MERDEVKKLLREYDGLAHDVPVEVCETHLSVVFLIGQTVFKMKRAVNHGFVVQETLQQRRALCFAEIQLNRRLAEKVYLGVVAIIRDEGHFKVVDVQKEDQEVPNAVEFFVKMVRLNDEDSLLHAVKMGTVTDDQIERVAKRIGHFHSHQAARGDHIDTFGSFETIDGNANENWCQCCDHVEGLFNKDLYDEVQQDSSTLLKDLNERGVFQNRIENGHICDCHGDLRLEHIYFIDGECVVIDCIEFNDRFRYSDRLADIAFLCMELWWFGRYDLVQRLKTFYRAFDEFPEDLLRYYMVYRAVVRAKVTGLASCLTDIDPVEKERASRRAKSLWNVALTLIRPPPLRPGIIMMSGLPGAGKSTMARHIVKSSGHPNRVVLIVADVVRKELAAENTQQTIDSTTTTTTTAAWGTGLYTEEWTNRTYQECIDRLKAAIQSGKRAIIDASFRSLGRRTQFFELGMELGVITCLIYCKCDRDVIHQRLRQRHDDPSDADWNVYVEMEKSFQPFTEDEMRRISTINTDVSEAERFAQLSQALESFGLRQNE